MSTVLLPPNSSSLFTFRAAEWACQINTGTVATPVWTWMRGLSKFEPVQDPTLQDDSDIDSGGFKSELVTAQKLNINAEGLRKGEKSGAVVVPDPGIEYLRTKGKDKGYDNIVQLRYWRTDDIAEAYEHYFAVKFSDVGGSNEDLQKFTATLSGRGKPTAISKPQAVDINEIQRLHFTAETTGGTFKLKALASETSALTFTTLTASALATAITGLASIGTGNATVTGNNTDDYLITFGGALAGTDIPALLVSNNSLTPSPDAAAEISTATEGFDAP